MGLKPGQLGDLFQGSPLQPQGHDLAIHYRQAVYKPLHIHPGGNLLNHLPIVVVAVRQLCTRYVIISCGGMCGTSVIPLPIKLRLLLAGAVVKVFPTMVLLDIGHPFPVSVPVQDIRDGGGHEPIHQVIRREAKTGHRSILRQGQPLREGMQEAQLLQPIDPYRDSMGHLPTGVKAGIAFHLPIETHMRPGHIGVDVGYGGQEQVAFDDFDHPPISQQRRPTSGQSIDFAAGSSQQLFRDHQEGWNAPHVPIGRDAPILPLNLDRYTVTPLLESPRSLSTFSFPFRSLIIPN